MVATALRRRAPLALALLLAAPPLAASWWDLHQADGRLDLEAAALHAVELVADEPAGADAVAAAGWWRRHAVNLSSPADLLDAAEGSRDAELGWALALLEGELRGRPPAGSLARAEVAGPFGVFDVLDLERFVVPGDADLPPLGTRFSDPAEPFRLQLTSLDGRVGPPQLMTASGVYLVAWTLEVAAALEGWLVVEGEGGFNLELDGVEADRRRDCGVLAPATSWYRVRLAPGRHRLRLELASRSVPWARVGLLDDDGAPLPVVLVEGGERAVTAESTVTAAAPPARAALEARLGSEETVAGLLLAAELARLRREPAAERRWLERAAKLDPESPWPHLGLAWFMLTEETGASRSADLRTAGDHLRRVREVPAAGLAARLLAVRERRVEDAERLLTELVASHGDDVRVAQLWVQEATQRGWVREAEEGLKGLVERLPSSPAVSDLRLEVLRALDRWGERTALLGELALIEPPSPARVDALASGCLSETAVGVVEALLERAEDPGFDAALIRLRAERGELAEARRLLAAARARWGTLRVFDELGLVLSADDEGRLAAALADALERSPSDLSLNTLAWRLGGEPFWQKHTVELDEVRDLWTASTEGLDSVLLLDQAVERLYPDGSSLYYYHGVSRAITPAGVRQATSLQRLPDSHLLKVRVVKPDGRVVVPPEVGADGGSLVLTGVEPGDLVEEEYVARVPATGASRRGHLPPYIYRFADTQRAFGWSEYVLLVPDGIDLRVDGLLDGLEHERSRRDDLEVLLWRSRLAPPLVPEPFAPPAQELLPWVTYGFNVSWQDVGDRVRDRALSVLRSSPELDRWAAALATPASPVEEARVLVEALFERVEAGRSMLTLGSSAGESFSDGEGNRLGILAAVLAGRGWQVDLVLARPRLLAGGHLEVPSDQTFGRPLLRASRDGQEVWFDADEDRRGVDWISSELQGGDGLLLPLSDPSSPVRLLAELPTFADDQPVERVRLRARILEDGAGHLALETVLTGAQGEQLMAQVRSLPEDRVGLLYQQMAGSLFPGATRVEGTVERTADGVTLRLALALPEACEPAGAALQCRSLLLSRPLVPALATLPQRRHPLVLAVPVRQHLELEIEPPEGWRASWRPRRLEAEWGSLVETLEQEGPVIRSVVRLELPAQRVAAEDYPRFARFCHAVDELAARPPRLERP